MIAQARAGDLRARQSAVGGERAGAAVAVARGAARRLSPRRARRVARRAQARRAVGRLRALHALGVRGGAQLRSAARCVALVTNASYLDGRCTAACARVAARVRRGARDRSRRQRAARARAARSRRQRVRRAAGGRGRAARAPAGHAQRSGARARALHARCSDRAPKSSQRLARLRLDGSRVRSRLRSIAPLPRFVPTHRARPHDYAAGRRWPRRCRFIAKACRPTATRSSIDVDRARLIDSVARVRGGRRSGRARRRAARAAALRSQRARAARSAGARRATVTPRRAVRGSPIVRSTRAGSSPLAPLCHRPRPDLLRAIEPLELRADQRAQGPRRRRWAHFAAARARSDNCFCRRVRRVARARSRARSRRATTTSPRLADEFGERVGRARCAMRSRATRSRCWRAPAIALAIKARCTSTIRASRRRATRRISKRYAAWGAELAQLLCVPLPLGAGAAGFAEPPTLAVDAARGIVRRGETQHVSVRACAARLHPRPPARAARLAARPLQRLTPARTRWRQRARAWPRSHAASRLSTGQPSSATAQGRGSSTRAPCAAMHRA